MSQNQYASYVAQPVCRLCRFSPEDNSRTFVQAGTRLVQCALSAGEPDLVVVARLTEQLARQGATADSAVLYMVNAPEHELVSLTPQPGFDGIERFPIKHSNLSTVFLSGEAWTEVRVSILPASGIGTVLLIYVTPGRQSCTCAYSAGTLERYTW